MGRIIFLFVLFPLEVKGEEKIVAKVGNYEIKMGEFKNKYKPYGEVDRDSLKKSILQELIEEKLFLIDAYNKNLHLEENVKKQVEKELNRAMISELYRMVVAERAKIAPWEIRNEWWKMRVKLRCSQIIVKDRKKVREIYSKLREGEEFEDLAKKYSKGPQAKYGGDIGIVRWGEVEKEVERVIFNLKEGEVSPPIKVRGEYRIIKVKERKEETIDFEKEKEKIKNKLANKKRGKLSKEYLFHLRRIAKIKYKMDPIKRLAISPDSVDSNEVLLSWVGGNITMKEFREREKRNIVRLKDTLMIKQRLEDMLTYTILLPIQAKRWKFHRVPKIYKKAKEREELLLKREYEKKEIEEKVKIQPKELEEYWATHRDKYKDEFEKVKHRVEWDLKREKKEKRRKELLRKLKKEIKVVEFWEVLKEVE